MKPHFVLALASLFLLASCGADKEASPPPPQRQTLNQRFKSGGSTDPNSYKRGADGKLEMDNSKRSQFENRGQATVGGKTYQKKDYRTGDYAKKSWWGNKGYESKTYAGPTDGSRFQTASRMDGQGARESGTQVRAQDNYKTGNYGTGDALEDGNMSRDDSVKAHEVGRTYDQFQYNKERDLSVEQSRSMLGR